MLFVIWDLFGIWKLPFGRELKAEREIGNLPDLTLQTKNNTKIIKNSGILYVRLLITTIVGLISTRLLLNALGVSDYGLYSIVAGIVVMMSLLNTVMMSTTYRYIAYEMGKNNYAGINQVFNISLIIHFCLA